METRCRIPCTYLSVGVGICVGVYVNAGFKDSWNVCLICYQSAANNKRVFVLCHMVMHKHHDSGESCKCKNSVQMFSTCVARVTVLLVCLSVCLCVDAYSGTAGYEEAY